VGKHEVSIDVVYRFNYCKNTIYVFM